MKRFLAAYEGRVLFVAESKGRRETLSDLFRQHAIGVAPVADFPAFFTGDAQIGLTVAPLQRGVRIEDRHIAIVCESELFPEHAPQARRRSRAARDPEGLIRDLSELSESAPVVHEHHGVGRYLGLFLLDAGGTRGEYLVYCNNNIFTIRTGYGRTPVGGATPGLKPRPPGCLREAVVRIAIR